MKRLVAWFVDNPVAANLLMVLVIAGGLFTASTLRLEFFPEFSTDLISVSVVYPGAAPEEVEKGICIPIEEAVAGLDGVESVSSTATEGVGAVSVEVRKGADLQSVLGDVKTRVDGITTFPEQAEEPVVQELLPSYEVLTVAVHGPASESSLRRLGERVRDEILELEGVTQVELAGVRPWEIEVALSEDALRRHGLGFDQVAAAIRRNSVDVPGGAVKTPSGEVLLRTQGKVEYGEELLGIALLRRPDGSVLRLGDVAQVQDGFAETDQSARFDGDRAVLVKVYRVGGQDELELAAAVRGYVEGAELPAGITATVWDDQSRYLEDRVRLLVKNGLQGFALVFLVLALFLRFRLAFWVSVGIPISFLGAIWLMPTLGVTINMISLFAFILVLGIVVDDAIVVGENIYTHFQRTGDSMRAAVEGTHEVAVPVTFAVLTTVAAFFPLLGLPGDTGQIWRVIPLIVIPVLLVSLVETKTILPAHLRHLPAQDGNDDAGGNPLKRPWRRLQGGLAAGLERFVERRYQPFLDRALHWRYLTVATGIALLALTVSTIPGGYLKFVFMPPVEADKIIAAVRMPEGTPAPVTARAVAQLEGAAGQLREELDRQTPDDAPSVFQHMLASVGEQPGTARRSGGPAGGGGPRSGSHLGEVQIELVGGEHRELSSSEISSRWRELTGPLAGASELSFQASLFSAGAAIDIQLASANIDQLREATGELKGQLAQYPGVFDISDSYRQGKDEIELSLTPEGRAVGVDLVELGRQVRQAFYGEEAQRILRGRNELKVMVRLPRAERESVGYLEELRVRTPAGQEIPFPVVADAELGTGFANIQRQDRQRVIRVTADVDQSVTTANEVMRDLQSGYMTRLMAEHPRVSWSLEGEQKEQQQSLGGLLRGFAIALLIIYALMAVPFRSYVHPVVIMSAIPFGLMGAIWGHLLTGRSLSVLSVCGMVALTGVVVNDSLVMVDYINRRRREGMDRHEAVRTAGAARFRAILLTSLTTFMGLLPLLLEQSLQAQFLIPMATSLAFGVLFATFVTLLFVPSSYLILEDVLRVPGRVRGWWAARGRVSPSGGGEATTT